MLVGIRYHILKAGKVLNQLILLLEDCLSKVLLSIGIEQLSVKVVCYLSAVLYLAYDVNNYRESQLEVLLHIWKSCQFYLLI